MHQYRPLHRWPPLARKLLLCRLYLCFPWVLMHQYRPLHRWPPSARKLQFLLYFPCFPWVRWLPQTLCFPWDRKHPEHLSLPWLPLVRHFL